MKRRAYMIDKDCNRWETMVEEDALTTHVVDRRGGPSAEYTMHKVLIEKHTIALVGVERRGMGEATSDLLRRALLGDDKVEVKA
jgi:hypothetical protein